MLTPQECQKTADDLERAARRMTLKAHHDAYMVVATEWRSLAQAVESGPAAPTRASMEAREQHLADLRAKDRVVDAFIAVGAAVVDVVALRLEPILER